MHAPLETAMRIAILRYPETFGLKEEEVNPLLQYTFVVSEIEGKDIDHDDILSRCIHGCEMTIADKIQEILKSNPHKPSGSELLVSNHVKKALIESTSENGSSAPKRKRRDSNDSEKSDKITAKQLRYLGYLLHQKDEKPDYKEIGKLTQQQATMQIKDLEKELK